MALPDGLSAVYANRVMTILAWTSLALVLISALALGANRPVSWTLLAIFVGLVFFTHLMVDLWKGFAPNVGRITFIAVLYLGVLAWAYFQTLSGLPEALRSTHGGRHQARL